MQHIHAVRPKPTGLAILLLTASLCACGGGGGGSSTPQSAPAPTAKPTAPPSTAPSAPPNGLALSVDALAFTSLTPQTFTASDPSYTGAFTVSSTCSSMYSVTPALGAGPATTFTVTPLAAGPSCPLTIGESNGSKKSLTVVVTLSQGVVQ